MTSVEGKTTKTLAAVDGSSLSSEPPVMADSSDCKAGSLLTPDENEVRVSATKDEGSNGDMTRGDGGLVLGTGRVVETEVMVQTSLFGQDRAVSGGGDETGKVLDSVLGVEKNEGNGVEKVGDEGDSNVLIGHGSDTKEEFNGNGISLVVQVHGSLGNGSESDKKCGGEDDKGFLAENRGVAVSKSTEMCGLMSKVEKNCDVTEGKWQKQEVNANGEENEDDDDDDDEDDDQDHEYLVGDFVWGKIRSRPWWPGQIYDPSDASEYAAKYNQKNRLLVAYFGDGSFSWSYPSQLRPFGENFGEMSKQSNSKSFVNAVHNTLGEIGRVVELEMTCSCIRVENEIGNARPVNAGIKAGVLVPEGCTGKLLIARHGPAELLAKVRYVAQVASITSVLELTVLKSWLIAFYRAKGGYPLPIYHEPIDIEGLEDKNRNGVMYTTNFSDPVDVPIQGPVEKDSLSLPEDPGLSHSMKSLLQKCLATSEDKLYQRRKQKSVVELMGEDMEAEAKDRKGSKVKGIRNGKPTSEKKKLKGDDEAESQANSVLTSPSGRKRGKRKKAEVYGSPKTTENEVSPIKALGGEDANESPLSRKWKRNKASSVENDCGEAKEETMKSSASRDRKKSKYLSPPYTNIKRMISNSRSKRDSETESEKIANIARMGERMTRAAGQIIPSPPILKCSGETFPKKLPKELGSMHDAYGSSSPQTTKQDHKKSINSMEVNATANEVLSEIRSAAVKPLYSREKKRLDMITGSISVFRNSMFLNGADYKMYHNRQASRKRKSSNFEAALGKDLNQTDHESPEPRSKQRGNEQAKLGMSRSRQRGNEQAKLGMPKVKQATRVSGMRTNDKERGNEQAKLGMPKVKQATRASGMRTNDKETVKKASPVTLILTFPPGFSLPSKGDLIKIFSKFGSLNEMETDVFYNSYCARVVFERSSDAEAAFNVSLEKSPFGAANVNYRLRYSSAAPRANEPHQKASSPLKNTPGNPVASQALDNEASRLRYVRLKLEMMTSMLENCVGRISSKMKYNLQTEMKGLLEEVSTMVESTSS